MKKSLLALAVLGAFAGAASAQSSVTLYGLVDMGFQRNDPKASGVTSVNRLVSGVQSGSRWGLRGSEDLGGGMRAIFTLESGVNVDDGSSGQGGLLFGRQAFGGLAGGFGQVTFGRQMVVGAAVSTIADPFGNGFGMAAYSTTSRSGAPLRINNLALYSTPNLGGFVFMGGYFFGELAGASSSRSSGYSVGAMYTAGPLSLGASLENVDKNTLILSGLNDQRHLNLAASYDFKVARIHLGYVDEKNVGGTGTAKEQDEKGWVVGFTVPLAGGNVLASYQTDDIESSGSTVTDGKQKVWALGYTYPMSRRTNLYFAYASANAQFVRGSTTVGDTSSNTGILSSFNQTTTTNGGGSQISLGFRHSF